VTGPSGQWRVLYKPAGTGEALGIVMSSPADSCVMVHLTGNAPEGGTYYGNIYQGYANRNYGYWHLPEQGYGAIIPCLIVNAEETPTWGTHWLSGGFLLGRIVQSVPGVGSGSGDDLPVVLVNGGPARTADPEPLWTTGSGSGSGPDVEGSDTADPSSWARDRGPIGSGALLFGDTPLSFWVVTRVVYNHAGDKKLYAFRRQLTFAADGRLHAVSEEDRITVDEPEACS